MNPVQRLIRADNTRKSRFHTSNGHLCLNPAEVLRSLTTTVGRVIFHRYSRVPWLAFPAVEYLEPFISGKRIFEFGSGMSTLWFARTCRQVISAESDSKWYEIIRHRSREMPNVQVIHAASKQDYLGSLSAAGGKFDLILIDGLYRDECLDRVMPHLQPGSLLVVDDTDAIPELAVKLRQMFHDRGITAFRGWVSGNLHPHETTIVRDVPGAGSNS
jgi:16S rRNA G966 N2-methylase RsmD